MAIVKKISELTPKGSNLANTDLLIVGVDNGTDYDLKSVTGAQLMGTVVSQTITDGDTTHSPSSNVVFDALALKVDKVAGSRLITSAEGTILSNTSGTNTGDQDLSGKVDLNTAIIGATKTKITYDSKGLVTSGSDATTADIADSLNKRYVTDANLTTIGNQSGTNTGDQDLSNLATKSNPTFTGLTTLDTLKVTTGNYITPVDVVGIDVTGNVNRVSAVNGRTALGLGSLATQNGTFSGTSSGTNTGDQDLSTYQPYTTATIGSVISFIVPQVYNSVASPSSSNITDSLTSAKIGVVQKIYHNHTVAPTFPAGWVKMGTATYTTSTLNVIFAEWVSSTRVEYWITKPS